jgi:hypothetical protein
MGVGGEEEEEEEEEEGIGAILVLVAFLIWLLFMGRIDWY